LAPFVFLPHRAAAALSATSRRRSGLSAARPSPLRLMNKGVVEQAARAR
jgi:hypothetical protein